MNSYSSARDEFKDIQKKMVFLDANENPFENGINRYPDPQQNELKNVISKIKSINKDKILIGNGSDEVLDLVFRVFCEPNKDNIITLPPTYGMYGVLANLNAIENREVPLTRNFELDVEAIVNQIDNNTKIIFICSPNNPTGNSFSDEKIITLLKQFSGIVLIDEAYIDFSNKESWLKWLQEFPNLIITQTLSKAYGMAGLRIGLLFASKDIIAILNKIKSPYNINILSQKNAIKVLEDTVYTSSQINSIKVNRRDLIKELLQIYFIYKVYESDANFILIKVDNANWRYDQLLKNNIVVRNRSNEILCDNCLRISIGTFEENEKLISVLKTLK
ncbi:histidinol-phosphate aminotransferase [Flavobacterium urocaniciphilum]|uniref:Histidinol-phosphate aminotransferase n=2 Tax=Flavobacterium urocaniciphilum TaxID=1299341 RepID=A0A1H8ZDT6_9FLAO|nr:histidinol-phosphate aminotransferase [Flavobacterium urocaniciphilum]